MLLKKGVVIVTMVLGAGLALGACGDREGQTKKDNTPVDTWSPLADQDALVGRWVDGSFTLRLDRGGHYTFDAGGQATSGSWTLAHGRLYMSPPKGNDEVWDFTFGDQQNTLDMSRKGGRAYHYTRS